MWRAPWRPTPDRNCRAASARPARPALPATGQRQTRCRCSKTPNRPAPSSVPTLMSPHQSTDSYRRCHANACRLRSGCASFASLSPRRPAPSQVEEGGRECRAGFPGANGSEWLQIRRPTRRLQRRLYKLRHPTNWVPRSPNPASNRIPSSAASRGSAGTIPSGRSTAHAFYTTRQPRWRGVSRRPSGERRAHLADALPWNLRLPDRARDPLLQRPAPEQQIRQAGDGAGRRLSWRPTGAARLSGSSATRITITTGACSVTATCCYCAQLSFQMMSPVRCGWLARDRGGRQDLRRLSG